MVALFLVFKETFILFSIIVVAICILTISMGGFPLREINIVAHLFKESLWAVQRIDRGVVQEEGQRQNQGQVRRLGLSSRKRWEGLRQGVDGWCGCWGESGV